MAKVTRVFRNCVVCTENRRDLSDMIGDTVENEVEVYGNKKFLKDHLKDWQDDFPATITVTVETREKP